METDPNGVSLLCALAYYIKDKKRAIIIITVFT